MPNRTRIGLLAAAIVVVVVGFVLANSTSKDADNPGPVGPAVTSSSAQAPAPAAAPAVKTVVVRGAKPVGGVQRLSFAKGGRVRFKVRSDVADEIHVHGYDLMRDVEAGGTLSFSFPATIDGRFEIELENHGEQIAQLEVTP